MDKIKVIKSEKDYEEALKFAGSLMILDPYPESGEGGGLALISTLIEDYETRVFPEELPGHIEAIKYRMEQANLKPVDLVRYIGSKSRVSEILSGKRQLTVEMIKAMEEGLGIPAKVLIRKPGMETVRPGGS
jgi:HTH-type transcriptional regulator / antitoxin HigA